jgi:acyl transferase domain-containing protein/acyl carrier protein
VWPKEKQDTKGKIMGNDGKIAIVGMDCRLPGANSVQEYWDNLVAGKETLTTFSDEELLASGIKASEFMRPDYVRTRGIIDNTDSFDAAFFGITPKDAEIIDPQQRVFLECAWHALEDAGIDPFNTEKRIAVFGGAGTPYYMVDVLGNAEVKKTTSGTSIVTSNDKDYLTTRVSYKLDLKGPSMNVQTACSTALVSVVLGVESLLSYQSDAVIVGGVSLELPEHQGYIYQEGGLQSPDGRCRTFDKDAAGTVFSRGCAVVVLKRLEDALADRDHIYAVVLGGAVNNDGADKVSFTAPSVKGQVDVITEALEIAGVDATSIAMVEAHGTSTPTGDPIEVTSLSEAFRHYTQEKGFCRIGSVKTNIGHTDVASGAASLIKVCLSLQHGIAPASLNFHAPNPEIDFENSPFYVNAKTGPMSGTDGRPLRALVNSFGVGGTNACIVVEEPPQIKQQTSTNTHDLLLVSAHNKDSFKSYLEHIKNYLEDNLALDLAGLAHTFRTGRSPMKYKGAIAFSGRDDLLAKLETPIAPTVKAARGKADIVWMFSGQGNQFVNMGRELYETNEVFKAAIDHCARVLQDEIKLDIREILYPPAGDLEQAKDLITRTYITQPAIFTVSYATAQVFLHLSVKPDALIGHSVGEYVAAVIAGVMQLDDALKAVAHRGKLVYDLPEGSMLAVLKTEAELRTDLPDSLDIAVINSPELCVVSGPTPQIETFGEKMKQAGVFSKHLPTSHAFHSKMMIPCLDAYRDYFKSIPLSPPKIPIISTVNAIEMENDVATDHEYWVQHVLNPVLFGKAVAHQFDQNPSVFLECGPGQSLESAVKRMLEKGAPHTSIGTLNEGVDAVTALDVAIGKLWIEGVPIDYAAWLGAGEISKIPCPLLPFQNTSYRIDFSASASASDENDKNENIDDWYYTPSWKRTPPIHTVVANALDAEDLPVHYLIFSDDELCEKLAAEIGERGFKHTVIRPDNPIDYAQLLAEITDKNVELRIIYGWTHAAQNGPDLTLENYDQVMEAGFYNLIHLEKALIAAVPKNRLTFTCLINDGFDVCGLSPAKPEKSLAVGPLRALFKEHPNMSTKLVNIDSSSLLKVSMEQFVDALLLETKIETEETIIAYTGLHRWTETFEPLRLGSDAPENTAQLKEGGIYLVTGGAGAIGRSVSKVIAQTVKATIIWIGRSAFPPKDSWKNLAAGGDQQIKERVQAALDIKALGSKLITLSADISDLGQMSGLVTEIESTHGPIDGIIHAAGNAGGGIIAATDKESFDIVLTPKVRGALVLHKIFKGKPLDFLHFYSSVTAILGEAGRVDYTSANAFLDAFGTKHSWPNCKTVCSINWGEWGLIGMGADWIRQKDSRKLDAKKKAAPKPIEPMEKAAPVRFSAVESNAGTSVYAVHVDASNHWIISEHLLAGIPTMVGTSFLGVLRDWAAGQETGGKILSVQDAVFSSPLIVMDKDTLELQLVCEKTSADHYNFKFQSRFATGDWKVHFSGKAVFKLPHIPEVSLEGLRKKCDQQPEMERHFTVLYDENENVLLQYSRRWDCLENITLGDKQWISEITLPDDLAADLNDYAPHPAMLDVATSCHFSYFPDFQDKFLPHSYGDVTIYAPLSQKIYAYGTLAKPYGPDDGIIHFDFIFFNETGDLIATMDDYALTKVGQGGSAREASNKPGDDISVRLIEAGIREILPDEGMQVLDSLFRQSDLSQTIVCPRDFNREFAETKIAYTRNKMRKKVRRMEEAKDIDDRPDIDTEYEAPSNEIEITIAAIWSAILGINRIGINDSFIELGGNSLLAIQLVSGLGDEFDVEIKASDFANAATIKSLADLVLTTILSEHDDDFITELLEQELAGE